MSSPTHPGYHYSAKIEVTDASTHANCPTLGSPGNPSAGILSPKLLRPGDEVYIAFSTFFPANFPRDICQPPVSGCFMQVMELYGPPFGGSPPVSIGVVGDRLVFSSSDAGVPGGDIWTSREPIHYGTAWEDIVIHVRCATDGTGFVELWHDGVRQTFVNGRTRYYFPTLEPGVNWNGTANYVDLNQYRGPNPALGDVILYHAAARIATSLPGVLPASRSWNPPLGWWPWMVLAGLGAGSLLGAGLARRRARTRTPGAEG